MCVYACIYLCIVCIYIHRQEKVQVYMSEYFFFVRVHSHMLWYDLYNHAYLYIHTFMHKHMSVCKRMYYIHQPNKKTSPLACIHASIHTRIKGLSYFMNYTCSWTTHVTQVRFTGKSTSTRIYMLTHIRTRCNQAFLAPGFVLKLDMHVSSICVCKLACTCICLLVCVYI